MQNPVLRSNVTLGLRPPFLKEDPLPVFRQTVLGLPFNTHSSISLPHVGGIKGGAEGIVEGNQSLPGKTGYFTGCKTHPANQSDQSAWPTSNLRDRPVLG